MTAPGDRIADCLRLGRPAQRALEHAGIVTFADLSRWTRKDIADLHGIGPRSFIELDPAMAARGLDYQS